MLAERSRSVLYSSERLRTVPIVPKLNRLYKCHFRDTIPGLYQKQKLD